MRTLNQRWQKEHLHKFHWKGVVKYETATIEGISSYKPTYVTHCITQKSTLSLYSMKGRSGASGYYFTSTDKSKAQRLYGSEAANFNWNPAYNGNTYSQTFSAEKYFDKGRPTVMGTNGNFTYIKGQKTQTASFRIVLF